MAPDCCHLFGCVVMYESFISVVIKKVHRLSEITGRHKVVGQSNLCPMFFTDSNPDFPPPVPLHNQRFPPRNQPRATELKRSTPCAEARLLAYPRRPNNRRRRERFKRWGKWTIACWFDTTAVLVMRIGVFPWTLLTIEGHPKQPMLSSQPAKLNRAKQELTQSRSQAANFMQPTQAVSRQGQGVKTPSPPRRRK